MQDALVDDRVVVNSETVTSAGGEVGPRGRVMGLAAATDRWGLRRSEITCIIDADRDHVLGGPAYANLFRTDGGSLDTYAFQPRPLEQFIQVVLGQRISAETVIRELIPPLHDLFVIRAVLHTVGVPLIPNHLACCNLSAHSECSVDVHELLRRSLAARGEAVLLERLAGEVEAIRARLPSDPIKAIRGHDMAPMLIKRLGLQNEWAKAAVVERAWRGCLQVEDLREWPLFTSLLARFT